MNYKIIEILKTFSPKETKRFDQFLHSPFYNESDKIRKLYKILLKFYPEFESRSLNEEKVSHNLNPALQYNKSTFKSLMSELANLADEFLLAVNMQGRNVEPEDYIRNEYFKRKLNKYVFQNIEETEKKLGETSNYNSTYFLNKYRLLNDKYNYFAINIPRSSSKFFSRIVSLLSERSKCISFFFARELLIEHNTLMTLNWTYNLNEKDNFIPKLFGKINFENLVEFLIKETNDRAGAIVFELHLLLYRVISDFENELNYVNYKRLLLKNIHLLSGEDVQFHFGRIIQYCKMNKTSKQNGLDFDFELFNTYKYMLLKGYYKTTVSDYMPVELFRIILNLGLDLKKYKWVLNFIKKYYKELHPDRKMNMYHYSLAVYYFHRKKFDETLRNLNKLELNHFILKVDLKNLLLMTYYELALFENALSLIDTYKHFLSNNEILTDAVKKRNKNFILVIQKMIMYKTSRKPMTKYVIKKNLTNDIPFKEWINEKFLQLDEVFNKSA
ncbi:MAG: hypothetical protein ABI462_11895 [Ignavibacteria bacterium]